MPKTRFACLQHWRGRGSSGKQPSCIHGLGCLLTMSVSACCSSRRAAVRKRGRGRPGARPRRRRRRRRSAAARRSSAAAAASWLRRMAASAPGPCACRAGTRVYYERPAGMQVVSSDAEASTQFK